MLARDIAVVAAGYLLGSIPSAHIVTRWRTGLNVRRVGDGNAGARNVWHMVGPGWGVLVGALDAAKGLGAVLLANTLQASPISALLTGPAAILGHAYPAFKRFQGGKGLSTTIGVLVVWLPWSTLASVLILLVTQLFLRNFDRSILFGASAAILLPPFFGYPWAMSLYALALFCLLWIRKLQDLPHERRVWAKSGWKDVECSDWYDVPAGQGAQLNPPEANDPVAKAISPNDVTPVEPT